MIRVLVVEDEPVAAEAHRQYVERVEGFTVVGVAHTGAAGLARIAAGGVDLVLLDLRLPDAFGLDLVRHARARGFTADVIAVTSVRDLEVVRRAMASGVNAYIIKPFTFAGMRAKLEQYAAWRSALDGVHDDVVQAEVDRLFDLRRGGATPGALPKGLSDDTLAEITDRLRTAAGPLSASTVGDAVGTSRVTARRYLEHLVTLGVASRQARHGGAGRPEVLYRWGT